MHQSSAAQHSDIVDTLLHESAFRTLLGALKSTRLVDELKQHGPFTLFAPTDEAFAKVPAGTVSNLEKPANEAKLERILRAHILNGRHGASDLRQRLAFEVLSGATYDVAADASGVRIGTARLVGSEITCTNGVIHVIDSVLGADLLEK